MGSWRNARSRFADRQARANPDEAFEGICESVENCNFCRSETKERRDLFKEVPEPLNDLLDKVRSAFTLAVRGRQFVDAACFGCAADAAGARFGPFAVGGVPLRHGPAAPGVVGKRQRCMAGMP